MPPTDLYPKPQGEEAQFGPIRVDDALLRFRCGGFVFFLMEVEEETIKYIRGWRYLDVLSIYIYIIYIYIYIYSHGIHVTGIFTYYMYRKKSTIHLVKL